MMFHKILVPLDGSPLAEAALRELPHVVERGRELRLVSVVTYPPYDYLVTDAALAPMVIADMQRVREQARAYLERVATQLRADGLRVSVEVHSGPIADTILDRAEVEHVDLIVMTTHGRGGLGRFVLGSVATKVVQHSRVPVLLVRPVTPPELPPHEHSRQVERV